MIVLRARYNNKRRSHDVVTCRRKHSKEMRERIAKVTISLSPETVTIDIQQPQPTVVIQIVMCKKSPFSYNLKKTPKELKGRHISQVITS